MLTTMDAIVLILIVGLGIWGGIKGFVAEVLALFTWFAAIYALKLLHAPASLLVQRHLVSEVGAAAVVAFAIVFGLVYLAGRLVTAALARRTRHSVLGPADRLLGAGFGALKGLLVATVAFLLINLLIDLGEGQAAARPEWMRRSRTYPLLSASGRAVVDWVRMRRGAALAEPATNAADAS
jgi:membrane protein required for colicin V production